MTTETTRPAPDTQAASAAKRSRKVRAAWISFAGRIAAQVVGAAATVAFAVVVLHKPAAVPQGSPTVVEDAASRAPRPSLHEAVAVLPFATASDGATGDLLARGLQPLLTSALVERGQIRVMAAAARWQGQSGAAAGSSFNARYVIDGTAIVASGAARVDVALTDRTTGFVLWARSFDGLGTDLLSVERVIAEAVAAEVPGAIAAAPAGAEPATGSVVRAGASAAAPGW